MPLFDCLFVSSLFSLSLSVCLCTSMCALITSSRVGMPNFAFGSAMKFPGGLHGNGPDCLKWPCWECHKHCLDHSSHRLTPRRSPCRIILHCNQRHCTTAGTDCQHRLTPRHTSRHIQVQTIRNTSAPMTLRVRTTAGHDARRCGTTCTTSSTGHDARPLALLRGAFGVQFGFRAWGVVWGFGVGVEFWLRVQGTEQRVEVKLRKQSDAHRPTHITALHATATQKGNRHVRPFVLFY